MIVFDKAIFLSDDIVEGQVGLLSENGLQTCVFLQKENIEKDEIRKYEDRIRKLYYAISPKNYEDFKKFIDSIEKDGFDLDSMGVASFLINEETLYVGVLGNACVYVYRNERFGKLLDSRGIVSGYILPDDILLISNTSLFLNIEEKELSDVLYNQKNSQNIVEKIALSDIKNKLVKTALYIVHSNTSSKEEGEEIAIQEQDISDNDDTQKLSKEHTSDNSNEVDTNQNYLQQNKFEKIKNLFNKFKNKRIITISVVILLGFLLVWSVVFGSQRRNKTEFLKTLQTKKIVIEKKLDEAEDIAALQISDSRKIIQTVKEDLTILNAQAKEKNLEKVPELIALNSYVLEKEKEITRKNIVKASDYYDLSLFMKNSQGNRMALGENNILILDNANGYVYKIGIKDKTAEKIKNNQLRQATLIAQTKNTVIVYFPQKGIYSVSDLGKLEKLIEIKSSSVVSLATFNNNIYTLDTEKDEIFKYTPVEGGYSAGSSYFQQGQSMDLKNANSIAIDGSVYVGFLNGTIVKYLSGVREKIDINYPSSNVSISGLGVAVDVDSIFTWNKTQGIISVFSKSGEYIREIESTTIQNASDIAILPSGEILLLEGGAIYSIK